MYVVVRFPKSLEGARGFDFNIYAKQNSQKEKMVAYYEELKARHNNCYVVLTTRENAKMMKKVWHNYIGKNIGREIYRNEKIRSLLGHNPENDRPYVARLRKIYEKK